MKEMMRMETLPLLQSHSSPPVTRPCCAGRQEDAGGVSDLHIHVYSYILEFLMRVKGVEMFLWNVLAFCFLCINSHITQCHCTQIMEMINTFRNLIFWCVSCVKALTQEFEGLSFRSLWSFLWLSLRETWGSLLLIWGVNYTQIFNT